VACNDCHAVHSDKDDSSAGLTSAGSEWIGANSEACIGRHEEVNRPGFPGDLVIQVRPPWLRFPVDNNTPLPPHADTTKARDGPVVKYEQPWPELLLQGHWSDKPGRLDGQHRTLDLAQDAFGCIANDQAGDADSRHSPHNNQVDLQLAR